MSDNLCSINEIQTWIGRNRTQWLEEYCEFLSFPSISSDFKYIQSMVDCQEWLAEYLTKLGFTIEIWKTSGHPIVFANYSKAGETKPTLLIYHHYDVQPVDQLEEKALFMPGELKTTRGNVFTFYKRLNALWNILNPILLISNYA
jgi:acetylornithine deacetylase/succinyl-diaminopimelate desuccinylase-like protein